MARSTSERRKLLSMSRSVVANSLSVTFGSHLIAAGVDLKTVSTLMGHSSISVTVDIYGHMLKDSNRDAVARLEQALGCKMVATVDDASRSDSQVLERLVARDGIEPPT